MTAQDGATAGEAPRERAIIDIGSNTVRLVIYGGPPRAPSVLLNEKLTARLGKAVAETGRLSPKAANAVLDALSRYRQLLEAKGVNDVQTVATAAVRDAADGPAFLARVAALGLPTRLLSGEEEAIASATGVIGAFPAARGVVADLGGGSLELVDVAEGRCSHGLSLPLGTLRLPAIGAARIEPTVKTMLAQAEWRAEHPGATLYLVGGSLRQIARYAIHQRHLPSDDPHGLNLSAKSAAAICRSLIGSKAEALATIPGLSSGRIASLPDAAALLAALVRLVRPDRVVFSAWGLREGLLYATLPPALRGQDPLLAGVQAYTARQGITADRAQAVADWASAVSAEEPDEARLRLAATLLGLALSRVEPNLRGDLAAGWGLRKRWVGITGRERAMLAAALMAGGGQLAMPVSWATLASSADLARAQTWGLATRLARRMASAEPELLARLPLSRDGERLVLGAQGETASLVNDAARRDLKALAAHLGLKADVRLGG